MLDFLKELWEWAKLVGAILLIIVAAGGLWYCDHVRFIY